jgi:adenine-specific DNA-methyltransferase
MWFHACNESRPPWHHAVASGRGAPVAARKTTRKSEAYQHSDEAVLRPEAGTQSQFKKKKPPKRYRYDSSLSPALDWDGQNEARELGEWLLAQIEAATALKRPFRFPEARRVGDVVVEGLDDAVRELKALSSPFLNWAGKAERLSFDVPTLPLFVHERLSTKAILETLTSHERDRHYACTRAYAPEFHAVLPRFRPSRL